MVYLFNFIIITSQLYTIDSLWSTYAVGGHTIKHLTFTVYNHIGSLLNSENAKAPLLIYSHALILYLCFIVFLICTVYPLFYVCKAL